MENPRARAQEYFQMLVRERFQSAQELNPQFSLRAFARRLGISHSALSEFLSGKRGFSRKKMLQLAERLGPSPQQMHQLKSKLDLLADTPTSGRWQQLLSEQEDHFQLIVDWHFYALRALMRLSHFKSCQQWMAWKLKSTPGKIAQCLALLKRLRLVEERDGQWSPAAVQLNTSDDVARRSIKLRHSKNLQAAEQALYEIAPADRYFSSLTLTVDRQMMEEFKTLCRRFEDRMDQQSKKGQAREVYELAIQFFPRTQLETPEITTNDKQTEEMV